jgi:phenylpropionate dioxygenase-like ring-hydroxylating dioxygenase large terminal subunit
MQNWYVACASGDLGRGPRACIVDGTPLVLFRDASGRARALVDRCPHRNMPLSAARVVDGALQCSYHGWRFGSDGGCLGMRAPFPSTSARSSSGPASARASRPQDLITYA